DAAKKNSFRLDGQIFFKYQNRDLIEPRRRAERFREIIWVVSPGISYFLVDNFSIGLELDYKYEDFDYGFDFNGVFERYSVGSTLTKYWRNDRIRPYINLGYQYYFSTSSNKSQYTGEIGMLFLLNNGLGITGSVKYFENDLADNTYYKNSRWVLAGIGLQHFF
ncbi:MAG: hypothetical protein AAFP70_18195, partial [Calditrichota bacterium]